MQAPKFPTENTTDSHWSHGLHWAKVYLKNLKLPSTVSRLQAIASQTTIMKSSA